LSIGLAQAGFWRVLHLLSRKKSEGRSGNPMNFISLLTSDF
jgi:hypothetical protein